MMNDESSDRLEVIAEAAIVKADVLADFVTNAEELTAILVSSTKVVKQPRTD